MITQIKSYVIPAVVLIVFGIAYYPSFEILVQKWSVSDDYAHAFFTVPIIAYMIWSKRELLAAGNGRPIAGIALIVASILFYLFSLQLEVPTVISIATVFTIISSLIYLGGFRILKEMAVPVILLFMIIPIPNQLLSMVTASLQLRVSEISELIIRLFSVPIFREGNVLSIPTKTFQVVEACSGIRSLISMTTLSLIIGYFTLTRLWSMGILFILSIPVAIVINILRVVILVLAYHFFSVDLAEGTAHTVMGVVLFGVGLLLLLGFQKVLELWETKK